MNECLSPVALNKSDWITKVGPKLHSEIKVVYQN